MMRHKSLLLITLLISIAPSFTYADKDALNSAIDAHLEEAWQDALKIWDWSEPGYQEVKSSALLADTLEAAGFKVDRGVAEIPTAFVASVGKGKPVIGIL